MLNNTDYDVIRTLVNFPNLMFGKSMINLYEVTGKGISLNMVLRHVLDLHGVTTSVVDYLNNLVKLQYLVNLNGVYKFTSLCTCGRCSRYVNRNTTKRVLFNKEGQLLNYVKEVLSGKDLNWTKEVLVASKPVEIPRKRQVKKKLSKSRKPKTAKRVAKVWEETTVRIQKKDRILMKIKDLRDQLKENGL